jgi:hypothetical protein
MAFENLIFEKEGEMMKKIGFLLICSLFLPLCLACNHAATDTTQQEKVEQVALAAVPTLNQKQAYSVVNRTKGNTINKDPKVNEERQRSGIDDETLEVQSRLETEVTAVGSNGDWTLANRLKTLRIRTEEPGKEPKEPDDDDELEVKRIWEYSFAVSLRKDGSIADLPAEAKGLVYIFGMVNPILLLPTVLLPQKTVAIGETWPFEISRNVSLTDNQQVTQNVKGTGMLKAIRDRQALMDFEYTVDTQGNEGAFMIHKVKSNVVFDLQKGQFLTNQLEITCETIGWTFFGNDDDIKSIFDSSVKVELAKP